MSKAPSQLKPLLDRLARLTSTREGLDATLMLAQYSSPFVVALLLRLAKFRADHPTVAFPLSGGKGAGSGRASIEAVAQGWGQAGAGISQARVIMRALDLVPIFQWLLDLHPNPQRSLMRLTMAPHKINWSSDKTLPTLQALSLLFYYPLEHLTWLAGKGVVSLSPENAGRASLWSCRFWALYVVLTLHKLRLSYFALRKRTRALRNSRPPVSTTEAEGYELQESSSQSQTSAPTSSSARNEQVEALKADWAAWKTSVMVNFAYLPLTVHWSTPGGIWTTPYITAGLGTAAAIGQLVTQWRRASA